MEKLSPDQQRPSTFIVKLLESIDSEIENIKALNAPFFWMSHT